MSAKLLDFIVCDDIRFEQWNKVSIMGIYDTKIRVSQTSSSPIKWPISIRAGFYVRLNLPPELGTQVDTYRLTALTEDKKNVAFSEAKMTKFDPTANSVFISIISPFKITGPGRINFSIELLDKERAIVWHSENCYFLDVVEEPVNLIAQDIVAPKTN